MKKLILILSLLAVVTSWADTPLKNVTITGTTSQIASGTMSVASGATFDVSAGTVTFANNQIPWAKVNKSGALLSDIGGIASPGQLSSTVNAQSGTTYTVVDGDRGKLVTLTNASPVAVTLPQAGASSLFISGWFAYFENRGAGLVTITPTTSTIDGAASITLIQNSSIRVFSNGTNYFTMRGKANLPAVTLAAHNFGNAIAADGTLSGAQPADADLSVSDVTTNNVTSSAHGFQKKLSNNSYEYADGTGNYSIPSQVPFNTQNAAYTFVLGDAGKTIFHDEVTARTYTIPANSSVAYPIGTTITIVNNTGGGSITLAITTDTLRRGDGTAGTGSRTIGADSVVTIIKTKSTEWFITGKFS